MGLIDIDKVIDAIGKTILDLGVKTELMTKVLNIPTEGAWHYPSRGEYPTDHTAKTRIVANNFGVTSAIYDWTENRWYDNYNCHIPIDNVYAWCELPDPPKEEVNGR